MSVSPASIEDLGRKQFWLDLNPELSITDLPLVGLDVGPAREVSEEEIAAKAEAFPRIGWMEFADLVDPASCEQLAVGLERLVAAGIPTPFLYVYDEVWQLLARVRPVLDGLMGPSHLVGGDAWVWHVSLESNAAGWAPHRDDNIGDGWLADGRPAMITIWIALTDSTIDNGCMYILPTDRDPAVPDNLESHEVGRFELAGIRAMPARAGTMDCWSTRLLHWGSQATDPDARPRMSLAIYVQRADVEPFDIDMIDPTGTVPLHYRLGTIAKALDIYADTRLDGTAVSEEILEFAADHRKRLRLWLAMREELQGTPQALAR